MTRSRLINKVRGNADFLVATRLLDELGLSWVLEAPRGKGHPYLQIGHIRYPVASSPRGHIRAANVRTNLMARLRAAGLVNGKDQA